MFLEERIEIMKRLLSVLLILVLAAGLAACGSAKKAEENTEMGDERVQIEDVKIDNPAQYAELGQYKGITIEASEVTVSEEEIDEELEDMRYQYSEYVEVTGRDTVKDEDIVNMDYVCTANGKTVDDYTQSDFDVTIGSGEMVYGKDFDVEKALVGKKVGDKVKVTGTFDDDDTYGDLAGVKATFEVTINSIEEEVLPELNDAFVKENTEYETLEEYRKAIRADLEEQAQADAENDDQTALWDAVVKNSRQIKDFPEEMVEKEIENTLAYEREWASYFGIDIGETREEAEDYFMETYEMSLEDYAKDSLFRRCLLELIVEKEGIEPTDKEVDKAIKDEVEAGGYESEEEFLQYSSKDEIKDQLIQGRVMEILEKNATIKK